MRAYANSFASFKARALTRVSYPGQRNHLEEDVCTEEIIRQEPVSKAWADLPKGLRSFVYVGLSVISAHVCMLLRVHGSQLTTGRQKSLAAFDGSVYGEEYASFPAKALMTASAALEDTQGRASSHIYCYVMRSLFVALLHTYAQAGSSYASRMRLADPGGRPRRFSCP